ncbi:cyclase family protein [Herbivorax sp. ANBcel31]|uniref:cyclase family protein n=1 Tax=Herbivorax sp. ANBcel31 TaxID=3069754 RepID=UPI0027B82395|nr:cyclase family protein [Herbivorax sp. ANBcel31]MDQ2085186.1 cyclase family protein [Herbivorax sp. ANBcel31]
MKSIVDLSHTIEKSMPVYPGDKNVDIYFDKCLKANGYNVSVVSMGMHSGTHIDTPLHLLDSDDLINSYNLDRFYGKGVLLDVRGQKIIKMNHSYSESIEENSIVLLYTGFDKNYGKEIYYTKHPVVDFKLAEFFIQKKIKMLGIDMPSPDKYPFEIHKMLFKNNILLLENMTNLNSLLHIKNFEITALPLKIKAEASPVRAVATY